jgi:NAD(P)-dependent dehydrogenase (short-subunit alcohol dehydrogenase family)
VLDVTGTAAVRAVVDRSFTELDRIDVVISNAGYGMFGAAEKVSDEQVGHIIANNLIGSIQLIRAALPYLRALPQAILACNAGHASGQLPDPRWVQLRHLQDQLMRLSFEPAGYCASVAAASFNARNAGRLASPAPALANAVADLAVRTATERLVLGLAEAAFAWTKR